MLTLSSRLGFAQMSLSRLTYGVVFLLAASYAFFTLSGPRGISALLEKQRLIHQMEKRDTDLAQEIERKRERIQRLMANPGEQELEIRQRLKLARPGEEIYIVGAPEKK
jgi:hypothetical protein